MRNSPTPHIFKHCVLVVLALAVLLPECVHAQDALSWDRGGFVFAFQGQEYAHAFEDAEIVDACAHGADVYVITGATGASYGNLVSAYRVEDGALRTAWTLHAARKRPWRVRVADVDGDGAPELALGVFNKARFHPVDANRPFVYNLHKNGLSPKWLGSRLSRPFEDFGFVDAAPPAGQELVAVEPNPDGSHRLAAYSWSGFGFTLSRVLVASFKYESFRIEHDKIFINETLFSEMK